MAGDEPPTKKPIQKLWWTTCCPSCVTDKIFYGWVILIVCTMGKIMSSPGQSPCIGPTTDAIMVSLGMTETKITTLYLFGTLASAFSLPQMGKVLDRVRPRKFIVGVSLCLGCACMLLSVTENAPTLLVAFFLLRFFGQGSMMMASQTPINYWYVTNRGSRMGIAGAFTSLFMMGVVPPLMYADGIENGWRHTYVVLATIAFCFAPIGWAFYRDTPETFGLLPDGRKPARTRRNESDDEEQSAGGKQDGGGDADDDDEEEEVAIEENWTLEEARRTVVFWTTSISIGQLSLTGTAFVFHFRRAMHDANIPDEEVDRLYLMISISSIISRIGGGFLLDKTSERFVMTLGMLIQGVGMTLMGWLTPEIAMVCAFIQGLSGGIMQNVTAVAYANFFGRTHLGSIQGFAQSAGVLGSALGPLPFGLAHDLTGSYFYAWVASGMVTFVNSIFCWKYMKRPVKQQPDGVYSSPAKELKTTAGERKGLLAAAADDNDDEE